MRKAGEAGGILLPSLFTAVALIVLVGLGTWQLARKTEKEALLARIERQLSGAPTRLPPAETWNWLERENDEFRRVRFVAEFFGEGALVYTAGSAFRPDVTGPGYWLFTPARLQGGSVVVVNRGFVPGINGTQQTSHAESIRGTVEIVGVMRWPETRGTFTPNDDPGRNIWFVRDPIAIASGKGWGAVAPFFIEQEAPGTPGGVPQVGPVRPNVPNNHLQYAITWYGLALVLLGVFAYWLRAGRRRQA
jgi:surfeit locus 1 family protein